MENFTIFFQKLLLIENISINYMSNLVMIFGG